jgi:hypothetical protein
MTGQYPDRNRIAMPPAPGDHDVRLIRVDLLSQSPGIVNDGPGLRDNLQGHTMFNPQSFEVGIV